MEEENQSSSDSVQIVANGSTTEMNGNPPSYTSSANNIAAEKKRIYKNILLISLAFLFNFNAFQGLSRLQSSLHRVDGMGVKTSAVIYGTLMFSCMFLPTFIIRTIGHRWTIAFSFSGYILYMAANGYAVWGTMITASVLVGLCAAPLWTAQCSYFTIIGNRLAKLSNEEADPIVSRFFGIFFFFFQLSSITGSIISSTVLMPSIEGGRDNITIQLEFCGLNDCPSNNVSNPNLDKPPSSTVWTMVGIYMGIACLAILTVGLFVDNLRKEDVPKKKETILEEIMDNFFATFKHLRHKEQWIIIPLTMYSGFEQAFYSAEFSKSFVTCSLGIWKIGLITLPYGIMNATVSFTGGHISKYTGRIPIFIFGMCTDLCIQFTLMFWEPDPDKEYVLYILAGMWGVTDGIWQAQINTVYGIVFARESEAAFSNYRMWESLGFIIAFVYSDYICTSSKLYVLLSVLIVGMIGYGFVEYLHRQRIHEAQTVSPLSMIEPTIAYAGEVKFTTTAEESIKAKTTAETEATDT